MVLNIFVVSYKEMFFFMVKVLEELNRQKENDKKMKSFLTFYVCFPFIFCTLKRMIVKFHTLKLSEINIRIGTSLLNWSKFFSIQFKSHTTMLHFGIIYLFITKTITFRQSNAFFAYNCCGRSVSGTSIFIWYQSMCQKGKKKNRK